MHTDEKVLGMPPLMKKYGKVGIYY